MGKRKKTEKRLTKRQRKELEGKGKSGHEGKHIHCVACGRHIDGTEFTTTPSNARWVACRHEHKFASCVSCVAEAQKRLDEHDRTGKPVQAAAAWH